MHPRGGPIASLICEAVSRCYVYRSPKGVSGHDELDRVRETSHVYSLLDALGVSRDVSIFYGDGESDHPSPELKHGLGGPYLGTVSSWGEVKHVPIHFSEGGGSVGISIGLLYTPRHTCSMTSFDTWDKIALGNETIIHTVKISAVEGGEVVQHSSLSSDRGRFSVRVDPRSAVVVCLSHAIHPETCGESVFGIFVIYDSRHFSPMRQGAGIRVFNERAYNLLLNRTPEVSLRLCARFGADCIKGLATTYRSHFKKFTFNGEDFRRLKRAKSYLLGRLAEPDRSRALDEAAALYHKLGPLPPCSMLVSRLDAVCGDRKSAPPAAYDNTADAELLCLLAYAEGGITNLLLIAASERPTGEVSDAVCAEFFDAMVRYAAYYSRYAEQFEIANRVMKCIRGYLKYLKFPQGWDRTQVHVPRSIPHITQNPRAPVENRLREAEELSASLEQSRDDSVPPGWDPYLSEVVPTFLSVSARPFHLRYTGSEFIHRDEVVKRLAAISECILRSDFSSLSQSLLPDSKGDYGKLHEGLLNKYAFTVSSGLNLIQQSVRSDPGDVSMFDLSALWTPGVAIDDTVKRYKLWIGSRKEYANELCKKAAEHWQLCTDKLKDAYIKSTGGEESVSAELTSTVVTFLPFFGDVKTGPQSIPSQLSTWKDGDTKIRVPISEFIMHHLDRSRAIRTEMSVYLSRFGPYLYEMKRKFAMSIQTAAHPLGAAADGGDHYTFKKLGQAVGDLYNAMEHEAKAVSMMVSACFFMACYTISVRVEEYDEPDGWNSYLAEHEGEFKLYGLRVNRVAGGASTLTAS